jgi:hypothetical protein
MQTADNRPAGEGSLFATLDQWFKVAAALRVPLASLLLSGDVGALDGPTE